MKINLLMKTILFAQEIFYVIFVFIICNIVSIFYKPKLSNFSKNKINIVLVHGILTKSIMLIPLKRKLEKIGFNVILFEYGFGAGNITENAKKLSRFLSGQMQGKTILMGHSLGGLIALEAKRIDKTLSSLPTITLASPIKGTPVAYSMYWFLASRQLVPNSAFIKRINKSISTFTNVVYVKSTVDEVVFDGYACPNKKQCIAISTIGHVSLIYKISTEDLKSIIFKHLNMPQISTH